MSTIVSKIIGDYGTDYSIVSGKNGNVKAFLAKRNAENNFDIFLCVGVNNSLVKQNIKLSECKIISNQ
jgi:hypothetical protein